MKAFNFYVYLDSNSALCKKAEYATEGDELEILNQELAAAGWNYLGSHQDSSVIVAAQFPCRGMSGFFLPRMTFMRDNEWRMQPEAVPPFIVQGAAKAKK